jgi:hypothetical protein
MVHTPDKIKSTLLSLLAEGNEVLSLAESQRQYMRSLEAPASDQGQVDPLTDSDTEEVLDWIEFRAEYERWYTACLGLVKSIDSDRAEDFKRPYLEDEPDLPSIRKALLRGFSIDNYFGFRDRLENQIAILSSLESQTAQMDTQDRGPLATHTIPYVDPGRLDELRTLGVQSFDLTKLIRLCEELNTCYANGCFFATAMLTRAIVDHVPPILGCSRFSEVANNYAGSRSFKQSMQHLDNSLRKIADAHLHSQIRGKETLPNTTQISFSNDLDVLLAEVVRVLK